MSFEVDPEKIPEGQKVEVNRERLAKYSSKFLHIIFESIDELPT